MVHRLLIDRAAVVATPEALASPNGLANTLRDASILIDDGRIVAIEFGWGAERLLERCRSEALGEEVSGLVAVDDSPLAKHDPVKGSQVKRMAPIPFRCLDGRKHVVVPGLINTHHHMYQSLTRAVPAAQNAELFDWLKALYPLWQGLTPEMIKVSTQLAMAELLLSGCTTSADHLYLFPNGVRLEDQLEAAKAIGMRFHASRGAMSVGESLGGLPPDSLVERESDILRDMQRVAERWHDAKEGAMIRVVLAPCSPFSVSQDLMRETASLARSLGVSLHTHLAENDKDIAYTREKFNCTPSQYAEQLAWLGDDVWHAHCVKLDKRNDPSGMRRFANSGTGVAHCPCSNMRLASGIAPVPQMLAMGVNVGLGVDGSASNDGASMMSEVRQAMLLARIGFGPAAMSARQALQLGTEGGARVLGRNDIGCIAVGKQADLAMFRLDDVAFAGAALDEIAALVFCNAPRADYTIVQGRVVVDEGRLTTLELKPLIERHQGLSLALLRGGV
jgi:8-oxoguanine deaminase